MRFYLFLIIISTIACAPSKSTDIDPYSHISDPKAKTLIQGAIEQAGGLTKWTNLAQLNYHKKFALLNETQEIEKSFDQIHRYDLTQDHIWIQSIENGDTIITEKLDNTYTRTKNGMAVDQDQTSLAKGINTSLYVIGLPYKLLDEGAEISYRGIDTIRGKALDVVEVRYNNETQTNHSSPDTWAFYFEPETKAIITNWIDAGDHYSMVHNLTSVETNGLQLYGDRESYRVDSLGNDLYLRATYTYSDYETIFKD